MGNVLPLVKSAPGRGDFGMASLKKRPMRRDPPSTPCTPALTVSVVRGGQVGGGAAVDDGVTCQVCKEGQSPHQPRSICHRQHRVRSCQPLPGPGGCSSSLKAPKGHYKTQRCWD